MYCCLNGVCFLFTSFNSFTTIFMDLYKIIVEAKLFSLQLCLISNNYILCFSITVKIFTNRFFFFFFCQLIVISYHVTLLVQMELKTTDFWLSKIAKLFWLYLFKDSLVCIFLNILDFALIEAGDL